MDLQKLSNVFALCNCNKYNKFNLSFMCSYQQVNLQKVGDDGDVSNYIPNSEWTLVKLHVIRNVVFYSCCAEPYPDVTYTIQIRRKPLFYVFNMILPCVLITLVALLGKELISHINTSIIILSIIIKLFNIILALNVVRFKLS